MTKLSSFQIKSVLVVLFLKIVILIFLPLTGDEAYFIKWAMHPSMGYYDHPPMIGWVLYLMSFVSDNYVFYRFFAFFTSLIIALVIYKIARLYDVDKEKSLMLYMIFLISPVNILLSLITNDIALVLFGSLGTLFLLYALEKKDEWLKYALLAGLFLGFAFLSKYFAVFILLSLLIFSFLTYKSKAVKIVLIVSLLVILAIMQNLYFNYNSCWNNILFNFFARTSATEYNFSTILNYLILIIYLMTPWGLFFLFRRKEKYQYVKLSKLLLIVLGIAFSIFFIVSLKKTIGLHWFLLFIPYMFLLFAFLDYEKLQKLFKYNAIFSFIHLAILLGVIFIPKTLFIEHEKYADLLLLDNPTVLCNTINKYSDSELFAGDYTTSAYLSYSCKRDINVMFSNSKYGRFSDSLLDVRVLTNKNIVIFDRKFFDKNVFKSSCKEFKTNLEVIAGAKFYITTCNGFNYEGYKKNYLDIQNEQYYNIPSWLPVGKCYFKDRYYEQE